MSEKHEHNCSIIEQLNELDDTAIKVIAGKVADELQNRWNEKRSNFRVEDEKHYNDHKRVDILWFIYTIAWKGFVGLMVAGLGVSALIGLANWQEVKDAMNIYHHPETHMPMKKD